MKRKLQDLEDSVASLQSANTIAGDTLSSSSYSTSPTSALPNPLYSTAEVAGEDSARDSQGITLSFGTSTGHIRSTPSESNVIDARGHGPVDGSPRGSSSPSPELESEDSLIAHTEDHGDPFQPEQHHFTSSVDPFTATSTPYSLLDTTNWNFPQWTQGSDQESPSKALRPSATNSALSETEIANYGAIDFISNSAIGINDGNFMRITLAQQGESHPQSTSSFQDRDPWSCDIANHLSLSRDQVHTSAPLNIPINTRMDCIAEDVGILVNSSSSHAPLTQRRRQEVELFNNDVGLSCDGVCMQEPSKSPGADESAYDIPTNPSNSLPFQSRTTQESQAVDYSPTSNLSRRLRSTTSCPYTNHLRLEMVSTLAATLAIASSLGVSAEMYFGDESSSFYQMDAANDAARLLTIHRTGFQNVKPHLRPTMTQLARPHASYLDMIIFPNFRERATQFATMVPSLLDESELCNDMMNGGLVCWGNTGQSHTASRGTGVPWDMRSWEAKPWFLQKWWFLVGGPDDDMRSTTRWWQEMRRT